MYRDLYRPALVGALALAGLIILLLTACTPSGLEPTPEPGPEPVAPSLQSDPEAYEVYLATAPVGERILSEEDAQLRALLGCGQEWPEGTVDYAVAMAYRPTGICELAEGGE